MTINKHNINSTKRALHVEGIALFMDVSVFVIAFVFFSPTEVFVYNCFASVSFMMGLFSFLFTSL
jgi:hypothetical protein